MRFMVLVKANKDSETGKLPDEKELLVVGKFNEQLIKDGVMLAGEGLHPSSKGFRMRPAPSGKRTVVDGPFAESKELVAGYWMIKVASREEAIERFSRCPALCGEIEFRQIFEAEDFEPVVRTEAGRAMLQAEKDLRDKQAT